MLFRRLYILVIVAASFYIAETASANNGITSTEIVIGQSVDLTGPTAGLGKDARLGAQTYFDSLNSRGGINGRKIVLKTLDDGGLPERAAANTKKLIEEEKVFALFGYIGGAPCSAAIPVFSAAKVPFIGALNGNNVLRHPFNRYIFNVRASFDDETDKIIEQLTSLGITKIAIFHPDDAVGNVARAGAEASMKKRGLSLVATGAFGRAGSDFSPMVKVISEANPQAVIIISPYKIAARFIKQMKSAGSSPQFMTLSVVGPSELARELGKDSRGVGTTQVVPFPFSRTTHLVMDYQSNMSARGNKEFSFTSLESFMAAKVLTEALKRTGQNLSREKLISTMEEMSKVDLGGVMISYSPTDHSGSKFVDITVIGANGKFLQ
jgi:ABC-type branched-subunit amino acid transport system substrate-binding protein